jgi:hypothetical protein
MYPPVIVLGQRGPTGSPRVTSGLTPLVARRVKLFANFLLVTNNLIYFIYFERLKEL